VFCSRLVIRLLQLVFLISVELFPTLQDPSQFEALLLTQESPALMGVRQRRSSRIGGRKRLDQPLKQLAATLQWCGFAYLTN
jgi:hypothetical protein